MAAPRLFVACTPRTGSTWFGRLIADALDIPGNSFWMPSNVDWAELPREGCAVVMHRRRTPAFEGFLRALEFRVIAMARHPLDVLLSILAYAQFGASADFAARWIEGECGNEYRLIGCSPASEAFATYATGWRAAALFDVSVSWAAGGLHASYERLVSQPNAELTRLCGELGVPPRNDIDAVLARHSLEIMRVTEHGHVWHGQPGMWRHLIVPELARAIRERHPEAFTAFGYDIDTAADLTPERAAANWAALTLTSAGG